MLEQIEVDNVPSKKERTGHGRSASLTEPDEYPKWSTCDFSPLKIQNCVMSMGGHPHDQNIQVRDHKWAKYYQ